MKFNYNLKLELMYYGINIYKQYEYKLNNGNYCHKDYITTSGISMKFDDIYVNAPLNKASKYLLIFNNSWQIVKSGEVLATDVKLMLPPQYALNKLTFEDGTLVSDYVNTHVDRIRIQPIGGCANRCLFCSCNNKDYIKYDINKLDKAFNIAMEQGKGVVRHALISGGTPKLEDFEHITEVYKFFAQKYKDFNFDVMMVPRGFHSIKDEEDYKNYIRYLKDIGIHGLYANIELFNEEIRKKYAYNKYEIGLENYIKFLSYAIELFGINRVCSCIIVGLEPIEDTLKGVELLCKIGCVPVLSPYVPINEETLDKQPTPEMMMEVRIKAEEIAEKYNVPIGPLCEPCSHNAI